MNKVKAAALLVFLGGVTIAFGGCQGIDDSESEEQVDQSEDPIYSVRVVDLDSGQVTTYAVRRSQQIQERDGIVNSKDGTGQARQAISQESAPCHLVSLRMWDQANYTGNQVCFTGTGIADLASYGFEDDVRSLKSGEYAVTFSDYSTVGCCQAHCTEIPASTSKTGTLSCESTKRYFYRNTSPGSCSPC